MSDEADDLAWLQHWYVFRCNGEWEHHHGLKLQTLDNPGWWLKIDLTGTELEGHAFPEIREGQPSDDLDGWQLSGSWWVVTVKDGKFDAACGPLDLINLPRRGPRPVLAAETRLTLKVLDDFGIPTPQENAIRTPALISRQTPDEPTYQQYAAPPYQQPNYAQQWVKLCRKK